MTDLVEWNNDQAFDEGWGIFECVGGGGDCPYELCALQNEELGDAAMRFGDNDEEAWCFVIVQANYGSAYHLQALEWLKINSPEEHERIVTSFNLEV